MANMEEWESGMNGMIRMLREPPTGMGAVQKIADAWKLIPRKGYALIARRGDMEEWDKNHLS